MVEIYSVEGNGQKLDGGAMFGNAPRALWQKWLPPDSVGRVQLSCRGMLIVTSSFTLLCETGVGCFFEPELADRFGVMNHETHVLLSNLERLGYHEDQIDYVVLSHLHFDHVGGLLPTYKELAKGRDDLHFPKAKYLVGAQAFARCQKPHPRDKASFIPGLSEKLVKSGRLEIIESCQVPKPLAREISFIETNGHTPGQLHTLVQGVGGQKAFFCGDLVPGTPWLHLPITMGYDRFPEKIIDEKTEILARALGEDWLLFYTHDPRYAASYCSKGKNNKITPEGCMEVLDTFAL